MKRWLYLFGIALYLLTGPVLAAEANETAEPFALAPSLRDHLPPDAIAYARIPNIWGMLAAPKGNQFDQAMTHPAMQQLVDTLQAATAARVQDTLRGPALLLGKFLAEQARSPLELAAMPQGQMPLPKVLATVAMDFSSHTDVNAWLERLATQLPLQVINTAAPDKPAVVAVFGQMLEVHFASEQQRLYVLYGGNAGNGAIPAWLDSLATPKTHPMWPSEQAVDRSGQGLFVWLNPPRVLAALDQAGMLQPAAGLRGLGLAEAGSLSLGLGTSREKGRLRVQLDMPPVGLRAFIPQVAGAPSVTAAGQPQALLNLSLPTPKEYHRLERTLLNLAEDEARAAYEQWRTRVETILGMPPAELLNVVGPDLMLLLDASGSFLVLQQRDPARLEQLLDHVVAQQGLEHVQREVKGQALHHLAVPAAESSELLTTESDLAPWLQSLAEIPTHIYWQDTGEYLFFAALPQILLDRAAHPSHQPVADWLAATQQVDPDNALLLLSGRLKDLPRRFYYSRLGLLQALADSLDAPLDLFALPPASDLDLAAAGAFSLKLESSAERLALELSFEGSPFEPVLTAGGIGTVALVGATAAVAIPAYQDYVTRAKVAQVRATVEQLQTMLEAFYAAHDRFPTEGEILRDQRWHTGPIDNVRSLTVLPDTGEIEVLFTDGDGFDDGGRVIYIPAPGEVGLQWRCRSTLDQAYPSLTEDCRRLE